jgi:hypothetical protein
VTGANTAYGPLGVGQTDRSSLPALNTKEITVVHISTTQKQLSILKEKLLYVLIKIIQIYCRELENYRKNKIKKNCKSPSLGIDSLLQTYSR